MMVDDKISYRDAGVDIDKGNAFITAVKNAAKRTMQPGVVGSIGGFAACFELDLNKFKQPVICACTDGVGTKLKLAHELNNHSSIGIDLVAMCANDLIVNGAKPLFFLDYYATGKLDLDQSRAIIESIATGCEMAMMALIGGETAEMPGLYEGSDYDLAGFSVGVVDKTKIIDGSQVKPGDKLIGIQSSGIHSNGFSLIRKLLEKSKLSLRDSFQGETLGDLLLTPTKIYVKSIQALLKQSPIHAMAHITGGGIAENLVRVLPDNCTAVIKRNSWQKPKVYDWLDSLNRVEATERYRTFNEGLGMIICVPANTCHKAMEILSQQGEAVWEIGAIKANAQSDHEACVEIV